MSCLLFLCSFSLLLPESLEASPLLMLNPVRLIFNGRDRAAQLSVVNTSQEATEYKVSVVPLRKGKDGKWTLPENITPQDEKISKMIRFSPRRSKIDGKSMQVIKFMLRKPADLPKGEYRARIILTPKRKRPKLQSPSSEDKSVFTSNVRLITNFPIIIQHNTDMPTIKPMGITLIDNAKKPAKKAVEVELQRKGETSSFGNIDLFYRAAKKGEWRRIGRTEGVAIYSPETIKKTTIPLRDITSEELENGMLRLEYRHDNGRQKRRNKPDSVRDFRL